MFLFLFSLFHYVSRVMFVVRCSTHYLYVPVLSPQLAFCMLCQHKDNQECNNNQYYYNNYYYLHFLYEFRR
jgi:hypothetical protein